MYGIDGKTGSPQDFNNSHNDQSLAAQQGAPFFSKNGGWRDVLGALSDGMLVFADRQPIYGPALDEKRRKAEAERRQLEMLSERFRRHAGGRVLTGDDPMTERLRSNALGGLEA